MICLNSLVQTKVSIQSSFTISVDQLYAEQGEIVGIKGASGSGKTTLLEMLGLLSIPESVNNYSLELDNEKIQLSLADWGDQEKLNYIRGTYISSVNQQSSLLPYFNVETNVSLPAEINNQYEVEYISELLEVFGLSDLQKRYPGELSAGQKQRAAIVRALASKPKLLLLDEPTSALNKVIAERVAEIVSAYVKENSAVCFFVSHDDALLNSISNTSFEMILEAGSQEIGGIEKSKSVLKK